MFRLVAVDYAAADAWKRRAESTTRAERLARQAVKTSLSALKARGIVASQLAEKARLAGEAAAQAAREAEKVWADTASTLRRE